LSPFLFDYLVKDFNIWKILFILHKKKQDLIYKFLISQSPAIFLYIDFLANKKISSLSIDFENQTIRAKKRKEKKNFGMIFKKYNNISQ